jgi:hypothetical protein
MGENSLHLVTRDARFFLVRHWYQNAKNIPNRRKIFEMDIIIPLQALLKFCFWYENKPSGNPAGDPVLAVYVLVC